MKKRRAGKGDIRGRILQFLLIVIAVFIVDRISKYLALKYLVEKITIIPHLLDLSFVVNTGAGFGLFKGETLALVVISLIIIISVVYNLKKLIKERYFWTIALIIGGAIANLFDRIFYGFVVDFLALPFWPVFNVADASISIGAVILISYLLKEEYLREKKHKILA